MLQAGASDGGDGGGGGGAMYRWARENKPELQPRELMAETRES